MYDAAEVWLEAGDWYVWQLVVGDAAQLPRSTCQAGYKAMWSRDEGYPSAKFFAALHPKMAGVVTDKMPGRLLAPGQPAGELDRVMAKKFGLAPGIPISAAIIDAHAGVPGAGVAEPDTMVMVMGTSSCHMLNARQEILVPGVAGVVADGILPGFYGYETGQAAVGDAFDWLRSVLGQRSFRRLMEQAHALPPGADGVRCLDWFNGCRTPLMDGSLRGAVHGAGPAPQTAAPLPCPVGSLSLRPALDHRCHGTGRAAGETSGGHRRAAASQSVAGANLRRRARTPDRRSSVEARTGPGRGHPRRAGGRPQNDGLQVGGGSHPRSWRGPRPKPQTANRGWFVPTVRPTGNTMTFMKTTED